MAGLFTRLGGQDRAREERVFTSFVQAVAPPLAGHSRPERLRGTTLFVRVESSVLAHELSLQKRTLLDHIAAKAGAGLVTDLRTRVGPLDD